MSSSETDPVTAASAMGMKQRAWMVAHSRIHLRGEPMRSTPAGVRSWTVAPTRKGIV